jgi:hypothetical protein
MEDDKSFDKWVDSFTSHVNGHSKIVDILRKAGFDVESGTDVITDIYPGRKHPTSFRFSRWTCRYCFSSLTFRSTLNLSK